MRSAARSKSVLSGASGPSASKVHSKWNGVDLCAILHEGSALVSAIDSYIAATRPFTIAKTMESDTASAGQVAAILYNCAEALRVATLMLYPAMPEKMAALWRLWSCSPLTNPDDCNSSFKAPFAELAQWAHPVYGLKPNQTIAKGDALFMRADPAESITTG